MKEEIFKKINDNYLNLRRSGCQNAIIKLALINPNIIVVCDPNLIKDWKWKFQESSKPFFLRMAGNGVVEQTAELAFLDLLKKHGRTNRSHN